MDDAQQYLELKLDDEPITCRSVWISDIHLGTANARVGELLDSCAWWTANIYLVGDFIDGWELKFRWFWREDYNTSIQKLPAKAASIRRSFTSLANHDEFIEQFVGMRFGTVTMARGGDAYRRRWENTSSFTAIRRTV